MSKNNAIVHVLHGDDEIAIQRRQNELVALVSDDPGWLEMNVTHLDGRQAGADEIAAAAGAMPFFVSRRMVIVSDALARLGEKNREAQERTQAVLNGLPPSALVVLIVPDDYVNFGKNKGWERVGPAHWLSKWAQAAGERAAWNDCRLPAPAEMARWVMSEAERLGGVFKAEAAAMLAAHTDTDTRRALLEIDKLLTYVNRARPVEVADVENLVAFEGEVNVFDMIDALAQGNANQAAGMFHRRLDQEDPASLFFKVAGHFRAMIKVREILDEGGGETQAVQELSLHPFRARKLIEQARRFRFNQLVALYHRLLEVDAGVKSGQTTYDLALDTLIADLRRA